MLCPLQKRSSTSANPLSVWFTFSKALSQEDDEEQAAKKDIKRAEERTIRAAPDTMCINSLMLFTYIFTAISDELYY
jgi:hypothetical protein